MAARLMEAAFTKAANSFIPNPHLRLPVIFCGRQTVYPAGLAPVPDLNGFPLFTV